MNNRLLAIIAALTATSIFGLNHTITKNLMPVFITPPGLLLARVLGACTLFWIISIFSKKEKIQKKDWPKFLFCSVFGMSINMISAIKGLELSTPINSSIISTISPIIVFIISIIMIKEKVIKTRLIGVAIGFIGAISIILINTRTNFNPEDIRSGNLLLLLNSISYAIYLVAVRSLTKKYSVITIMKWLFLLGAILNTPFSIHHFLEIPWEIYDKIIFLKIGFVITGATFAVYLLNVYALKTLKASTVGMFIYLQPIIGIIYAISTGSDILKLTDIMAVCLVFTGIYLVSLKKEAN
ncbi:MAG: DMT family transporter [Flavobacteriaceae bacterium]|nr:DMT family transporter [Flavobacteriaceae bacterium]